MRELPEGGRLGLLGGSFNPIHNGHVRAAVEVREVLGLSHMALVPTYVAPHKSGAGLLPFDMRLDMARKAVEGVEGVVVSDFESRRQGPSYTFDTLSALRQRDPTRRLVFVLGLGDLLAMPSWHRGLELTGLAGLAVLGRAGLGLDEVERFLEGAGQAMRARRRGERVWSLPSGEELRFVEVTRMDISSSLVRQRFLAGASLRGLVPESVERLLAARHAEVRQAFSQGVAV